MNAVCHMGGQALREAQPGIAVGCGLGDQVHALAAGTAGDVGDIQALAEILFEDGAHLSDPHVSAAACAGMYVD